MQYIILIGGPLAGTILQVPKEEKKVDVVAMEYTDPPKLMYENTDRGQLVEIPSGIMTTAHIYQINWQMTDDQKLQQTL